VRKNLLVAGILSLLPGMGNIYNGLYIRGITFFLVVSGLMSLASRDEEFVFAIVFVWFFNIVDAVRQASLINYGYAHDLGLIDLPAKPKAGQGGLFLGVMLIAIGFFALLDRVFDVDLRWLIDAWPALLILIGGWLVWAWYRERNQEEKEQAEPVGTDTELV
jgi:hypothetical protein